MLIALGAVGMVVSLAADALGIGNRAGIGWKQLLGAAAGVLVVFYGTGRHCMNRVSRNNLLFHINGHFEFQM